MGPGEPRDDPRIGVAALPGDATLGPVVDLLECADEVAREVGYPEAGLRDAYRRQVLMLLSQAYVQVFGTSVQNPDWVPHTGPLFPWGAPNHDTIYGFAPIESDGTYRVSGIQGSESIASLMFRKGGANTGQMHGATLGEIDVQAIRTAADRRFSLLISARRPQGHAGLWYPLPAGSTGLVARHVTQEPTQRDGVWTLERLDRDPGSAVASPQDVQARVAAITGFVRRLNEFLLRLVKKLRDDGFTNAFLADRFQGYGGIAAQMYFQCLFEFDDDEVLVVESEMPKAVHYWSVQLLDPFFSAIDFIFHSSAYNGSQASVDPDGRVRFVVAARDPGVANWLDPAGWQRGGMFWRWHTASSFPQPSVKRVKIADLWRNLPADTPRIDAAQRRPMRSARIAHYQSRRRW
jgi:hypothetical protein